MIIKANRVAKLSRWSQYPRTYAAIVAQIPDALWRTCTSVQLVQVIEVIQSGFYSGQKAVERESDAGYICTNNGVFVKEVKNGLKIAG